MGRIAQPIAVHAGGNMAGTGQAVLMGGKITDGPEAVKGRDVLIGLGADDLGNLLALLVTSNPEVFEHITDSLHYRTRVINDSTNARTVEDSVKYEEMLDQANDRLSAEVITKVLGE